MNAQYPSEKIYAPRGFVFKTFIQSLLQRSGMKKRYIDEVTNDTGMALYSRAFTHLSIDADQNYEFLEILGDVTCNKIVVWYIKDRFPVLQNTAGVKVIARLRINLVSKKNFSLLAENLGFGDFISCEKEIKEQKEKSKALLEDVFEAFFGATEMLLDSVVHPGAGYGICFKILKSIFDELPISLKYEDLYDPITRLKETFDFYRANNPGRQCPLVWGTMLFENTKTEKGQVVHLFQVDKSTHRKKLLSVAEAPFLEDAKHLAASKALHMIEREGFRRPIPEYYSLLCIK
jgi:dsRNA-specific ribonuclease